MLILFLKLLLAHIIGDFVLQTKALVVKRGENIFYLLLHISIHAVLLCVVLLPHLQEWWLSILGISIAHLAIDSLKILSEKKWPTKPVTLFITDQALHLMVIAAVVFSAYGFPEEYLTMLFSAKSLLYIIAFLLLAVVSPVFLRVFFSKWDQEHAVQTKRTETLIDAGLLIGIMERLMIAFFIQIDFLEGIGILLAAKSIFRFGDLTNAKNTKFTEYVLVGTLASFLIAIIIGYAVKLVSENVT
jgi:hypothetical protein